MPTPSVGPLRFLFGFEAPVGRAAYAATGVGLAIVKYAIDAGLVYLATQKLWSPIAYLSPLLSLRERSMGTVPEWLLVAMALNTLPFLWIGVSMSVRRALNAGLSAWAGLAFLVPVLNYLVMLGLSLVPTRAADDGVPPSLAARRRSNEGGGSEVKSALFGLLAGFLVALSMAGLSIYALGLYGAALFFITPFVMGAASAFIYNRKAERGIGMTLIVSLLSVVTAALSILLFALEGVVCIAMAAPIAAVLSAMGSLVGRAIALSAAPPSLGQGTAALMMLPMLAGAEASVTRAPLREVATVIEVDAPAELVWTHVVGFTELPPPPEWFFKLGVAYPMRAKIAGSGVGAVRRCEFSTGAFVEPITVWDEPKRLAFDVSAQPPPMHEWSPYRHVAAPHLDGYLRSKRGEFRLIALSPTKTRLEGSTFYEVELFPQGYWAIWTEGLLHAIHGRVLRHVKSLAEADAQRAARASL